MERGLGQGCAGERRVQSGKIKMETQHQTQSRFSRLSAELFVKQLCMKPTFSTALEDGKDKQKSPMKGLTSLFLALTVFVPIYSSAYFFMCFPKLAGSLGISLFVSASHKTSLTGKKAENLTVNLWITCICHTLIHYDFCIKVVMKLRLYLMRKC